MSGVRARDVLRSAVLTTAAVLLALLALTLETRADDYWALSPGQTGDWSQPANWNAGRVPNTSDTAFVQNGGAVIVTRSGEICNLLMLGATGTGSIQMQGGSLATLGDEDLGGDLNTGTTGIGSFTLAGGTNSVGGNLNIGADYGSVGTYSLIAGSLSGSNEYPGNVGSGALLQSGGTNSTAFLAVTYSGSYLLSGGLLSDSGSLLNAGVFSGGSAAATLNVGGIMDLTGGTWQNLAKISVNMGSNSLLIVPKGFNTATGFAHYASLGLTFTAGSTITVPAGHSVVGCDFINNFVSCMGSIIASVGSSLTGSGGSLALNNGLMVSGNGVVQLGNGALTINDFLSGISGGLLSVASQYIGYGGSGFFAQTGGINQAGDSVILGYNSGDSGGYSLSGTGQLSVGGEDVGFFGKGAFTQSGGTNAVGYTLNVGYIAGSSGTYSLNGGRATVNQEDVGVSGSGLFTQSGGTNAVSYALEVGDDSGYGPPSSGTYLLSGSGWLSAPSEEVGYFGSGVITQNGGTNIVRLRSQSCLHRHRYRRL